MSFDRLLAAHPSATIVDVDEETVVDGLLGTGETEIATDVPVWVTDLDPSDVELDEAGQPQTDAEIIVDAGRTLSTGWEVRLADGRVYVVTGSARIAPTPRGEHHRTYPARRAG